MSSALAQQRVELAGLRAQLRRDLRGASCPARPRRSSSFVRYAIDDPRRKLAPERSPVRGFYDPAAAGHARDDVELHSRSCAPPRGAARSGAALAGSGRERPPVRTSTPLSALLARRDPGAQHALQPGGAGPAARSAQVPRANVAKRWPARSAGSSPRRRSSTTPRSWPLTPLALAYIGQSSSNRVISLSKVR